MHPKLLRSSPAHATDDCVAACDGVAHGIENWLCDEAGCVAEHQRSLADVAVRDAERCSVVIAPA